MTITDRSLRMYFFVSHYKKKITFDNHFYFLHDSRKKNKVKSNKEHSKNIFTFKS